MAMEKKKVGEDWTDSVENFKTTGTLESGAQTVTGGVTASGTVQGATVNQGANQVLDVDDLVSGSGSVVEESDIVNTGPSAPSTTFAGMFWFDTANNLLKIRNEANDGWLDIWDTANNKPVITNLTDEVLGTMLADAVAGAGLIKDGSENLAVQVDDSSIEISSDVIQVKALGITEAMLAAAVSGLLRKFLVSANDTTVGYLNGKLVAGDNVSLTENNDGANETLTIDKKFRGALLYMSTSDTIVHNVPDAIDWEAEHYDTDGFADIGIDASIFTIPANVSRVKVTAQIVINFPATSSNLLTITIQGAGIDTEGQAYLRKQDATYSVNDDDTFTLVTAPLSVSQGDTIYVNVSWTDTTGSANIDVIGSAGGNKSWFSIEVIE